MSVDLRSGLAQGFFLTRINTHGYSFITFDMLRLFIFEVILHKDWRGILRTTVLLLIFYGLPNSCAEQNGQRDFIRLNGCVIPSQYFLRAVQMGAYPYANAGQEIPSIHVLTKVISK